MTGAGVLQQRRVTGFIRTEAVARDPRGRLGPQRSAAQREAVARFGPSGTTGRVDGCRCSAGERGGRLPTRCIRGGTARRRPTPEQVVRDAGRLPAVPGRSAPPLGPRVSQPERSVSTAKSQFSCGRAGDQASTRAAAPPSAASGRDSNDSGEVGVLGAPGLSLVCPILTWCRGFRAFK